MQNRNQYPPEWFDTIRPRILKRDNYACTSCHLKHRSTTALIPGEGWVKIDFSERAWYAERAYKVKVIYMHVAHLDNNKQNCSDENLSTKCPRCHGLLDKRHKALLRIAKLACTSNDVGTS